MTVEQLEEMGILSEVAMEIAEAFALQEEETVQLKEEVETLRCTVENERIAREEAALEMALEKEIAKQGGKNAKAILALANLEGVTLNGEVLTGLDLEQVKAEAPYLFYEKEEKIQGTGYGKNSKQKESDISKAFKTALRR